MAEGSGLTPEWIAAQRWFRSKGRPVASVSEFDRAPLGARADLTVLELTYADGGEGHRYLAPTVEGREPHDGEGAWASIVLAIAAEAELPGTRGRFRGTRADALEGLLSNDLREQRIGVEQSNTSVRVGNRLILKVYRLLEEGENPEVEMSAFLTDAGFDDTPALAGAMTYEADGVASAAMLQAFVPSTGDGWAAMLRALADDADGAPALVERIGNLTARMHAALASRPDEPAFPARAATAAETAGWRASAERQLAQAVTAVSGAPHDRLVALAPRITARFADTFGSASGEARVSRIHGDYHLAQLLARPDGGFSVIDFEGEPARPVSERRAPGSPLRDVAGMLRSLDYAARSTEVAAHGRGFAAEAWLATARAALLDGYGGIAAHDRPLLAAFELEKACYEVRYEAGNRPDWLWLPIA
ncbi:MAG: maltokinase N-terminal cap-like domain-containing protein, partial [Candidatus Limnocylindria bacterium]